MFPLVQLNPTPPAPAALMCVVECLVNTAFQNILSPRAEVGLARFMARITTPRDFDDNLLEMYVEWRRIEYLGTDLEYDEDEKQLYRELCNLPTSILRRLSRAVLRSIQPCRN